VIARLVLALIAAVLVAAPAADAAPVALLDAPNATGIALAGSEVVVARTGARGRLEVDAVPSAGGPARQLLTDPGQGKGWTAAADVRASAQRVAVRVTYGKPGSPALRWRLYTGPVAGPLQLEYQAGAHGWSPDDVAVDGDRVVALESRLTSTQAPRLRLFAPGAAPRVLTWASAIAPPLALAGSHIAFSGSSQSGPNALLDRVFVADVETGAHQVSVRDDTALAVDLTSGGRVVTDSDRGLLTAAPGVPATVLPGSADVYFPRFAGAGVAALQRGRFGAVAPVVLDAGAAAPRAVGVPSFVIDSLDAGDAGVAWLGNGCVLFARIAGAAPAEPPAGPCPRAEVALARVDGKLHGRVVKLRFACLAAPAVTGCRAKATLRLHGAIGRKAFRAAAGKAARTSIRLSRRGARRVRRAVHGKHGFALIRLRVTVQDGRSDDRGSAVVIDRVS
jgi:hypothetical protein